MTAILRLSFSSERTTAFAELLWKEAPRTCDAISRLLPLSGVAHHAIYSGSECVMLLDKVLRLDPENASSNVSRGDVAFTWMAAGSSYGVNNDFSEICWFYDIDAQPRMSEGPVAVNIFARIVEPAMEFYAVCHRMRRDGIKPLKIELIT